MKGLLSILALALALAFTGPAFAGGGDPTAAKTEADCTKAGGVWDAATNKCERRSNNHRRFRTLRKRGVGFGRRPFFKNC